MKQNVLYSVISTYVRVWIIYTTTSMGRYMIVILNMYAAIQKGILFMPILKITF